MALSLPLMGLDCASAFQINPLKNKYHGNRPQGGFWEHISQPVHEEITDAAVRCAAAAGASGTMPADADVVTCPAEHGSFPRNSTGNKYNPLIRGVWWNDDPNQHLFGVHYATWAIWMRDAKGIATKGHNWLGEGAAIGPSYKMQYRSHYGDLQFLHSMANSDGEPAALVQTRILDWIEFAYAVATERLDPEVELGGAGFPITRDYFSRQSGWTINHLFAPKFTLGKDTIKEVALGSILHVVQDSFSEAHVERDYSPSAGCAAGRITEFHAYGRQDVALHNDADTRSSWLGNPGNRRDFGAVQASAQLLLFAKRRSDWATVVRPYLQKVLFCIEGDANRSSAGRFAQAALK